jgi:hypothetical protein
LWSMMTTLTSLERWMATVLAWTASIEASINGAWSSMA